MNPKESIPKSKETTPKFPSLLQSNIWSSTKTLELTKPTKRLQKKKRKKSNRYRLDETHNKVQ